MMKYLFDYKNVGIKLGSALSNSLKDKIKNNYQKDYGGMIESDIGPLDESKAL
jgi:hypothetical protein